MTLSGVQPISDTDPDRSGAGIRLDDGPEQTLRARLTQYIARQTGATVIVEPLKRYPVGFSWITYGFRAVIGGIPHDLILRLGPSNGLFAPYSARPQFELLDALDGGDVPLPKAYWYSDDPAILGLPFFVCAKVDGDAPIPWVSQSTGAFEESYRIALGRQFVEALAAIHNFKWQSSKLKGWDNGLSVQSVASHEIQRWSDLHRRWALRPFPMIVWALQWLRQNRPVAPRISIVHGDYRLGNFLEKDGRITAILDWELVHLGDPHEDIGWACLPQYMGGSGLICRLIARDDFFSLYQRLTGIAVDPALVRFYTVFSLLKLALTHMAAVRCFEDGQVDDIRMPAMGTQIMPVLRQIEKALEERP